MTPGGETMYENNMGKRAKNEEEEEEKWANRAIVGDRSTDLADKFTAIRPSRSGRELPKVINSVTVSQATWARETGRVARSTAVFDTLGHICSEQRFFTSSSWISYNKDTDDSPIKYDTRITKFCSDMYQNSLADLGE